jgi:pimeloyl-ACP methyl ester carboxylesterase
MLLASGSEFLGHLGPDGEPDAFHACFRRLTVHTMPGLGHMMHHEEPSQVARAVEDWYAAEPDA